MTASIDAKNKSARCLLKWVSEELRNERLTEVLKNRVTRIECEGTEQEFQMLLRVDGGYAQKILEMSMGALTLSLKTGFREQGSANLNGISVEVSK